MFDNRMSHAELLDAAGKQNERLVAALSDIERLRAALDVAMDGLERVTQHDPKTPGLHYKSIDQLLWSAVGCARLAFEGAKTYIANEQKVGDTK